MKLLDPICKSCRNRTDCKTPCPPVQWIDGNVSRREPLMSDMSIDSDHTPAAARDYNAVIADLLRARTQDIDNIRAIKDTRIRAIASMLAVNLSRQDIAELLSMSYRQLARIIKHIS